MKLNKFNPTHKIINDVETSNLNTGNNFKVDTLVEINTSLTINKSRTVLSKSENGLHQFVDYKDLALIIKK